MHFAITGPGLDHSLLAAVGVAAAVLALFLLHRVPRLAFTLWITVLCFVPIWLGINIGFNGNYFLPLTSAFGLLVICSFLPTSIVRLSLMDGVVVLLVVVCVAALFAGNNAVALTFLITLVTYFLVGYILGRIAPLKIDPYWIYGVIAIVFTVVAILAIIEFVAVWNPFVLIKANNLLYDSWGTLQPRGGVLRAEGAFGHSIALGSSLAMAIPLTLASRFRFWIRAAMITIMLIGTVVTFSRIGMIGALLGLILSVVFMKHAMTQRARIAVTVVLAALAAILFPLIDVVFNDAGTEASGSAAYRGDLTTLIGTMNIVGVANSARRGSEGQLYFGDFQSIDSQLILTGLTSGSLILAVIVVALLGGIWLVLRGWASPATIAVVAQIPALATVALITQYSIFFWFLVGFAASTQLAAKHRSSEISAHDVDISSSVLSLPEISNALTDRRMLVTVGVSIDSEKPAVAARPRVES